MTDFPDLKLKALVSFPAAVLDGAGIDIVKANGTYTFNLDFGDFGVGAITDPVHQNILVWNDSTGQYVLVPASVLIPATPGSANPIMDGVAAPGVATPYSRQDHVHPSDTARAATVHTHVAADVTDFSEATDDRVAALLVAGTNVTLTYNDPSNTLTIASATATPAGKNYVVNGAMMVSQENGTTAGTTAGYYPVDEFQVSFAGTTGTYSTAQVASTSTAGSPNRLRVTVTASDAAVAAGDTVFIQNAIEGLRVADLLFGTASAKPIIIRFGVKAPTNGASNTTYCVVVTNNATNRTYVAEYTINHPSENNIDTVKSVTFAGDTSGTWLKDNGKGITIRWGLMAGSTFQQAAGSWGTVNAVGSSNQFNFMGTNSNVFELFDVGLYQGSVAPSYIVADYVSELALCRRYYERQDGRPLAWSGGPQTGSAYAASMSFSVIKRAIPVMVFTPVAVSGFPSTAPTGSNVTAGNVEVEHNCNVTSGYGYYMFSFTANARL